MRAERPEKPRFPRVIYLDSELVPGQGVRRPCSEPGKNFHFTRQKLPCPAGIAERSRPEMVSDGQKIPRACFGRLLNAS